MIHAYPTAAAVPEALEGRWQPVAIDVLRATSVIVTALANGAEAVVPTLEPREALEGRDRDGGPALAAGERGGLPPEGFDLGNSPADYRPEVVGGRRVYLSTTNGTRLLLAARRFGPVLCASFRNLSAVVRALRGDVLLLCAGTDDQFSADDLAVAGAIVSALPDAAASDLAMVSRAWYEAHRDDLAGMLAATRHGRILAALGLSRDVRDCAVVDAHDLVPVYHEGEIRPLLRRGSC